MTIEYDIFVTRGLGDNSYLIKSGDEAAVIDPQRDAWRFISAAEKHNVGIKYVFETHVHNDYISGAFEIHDKTGAELAVPSQGNYQFKHKKMHEGNKVIVGELSIQAWHTPGHTYEHTSWLVSDNQNTPIAIFTGGSLLVGSAGRTDLLGHTHTNQLTEAQYSTVQRIVDLPDSVQVLPTHGSGSFCSASNPSNDRVSTVGNEKLYNQAVLCNSIDEFMNKQLSGLLKYPNYYKYMADQNRAGVDVFGSLVLPPKLSEGEFDQVKSDTKIIDTRNRNLYAAGHLNESVNIEKTFSFGTYVGWLIPYNDPIILVIDGNNEKEDLEECIVQLFRIGIHNIKGYISSSDNYFKSRATNKFNLANYNSIKAKIEQGEEPIIIDVRDPVEWESGLLPNTKKVFLADIPSKLEELREEFGEKEVYTICVTGERATVGNSFLRSYGINAVTISNGGINDLLNKS